MTVLLQAKNLGFTLGTKPLFNHLQLIINQGDRIGLVGHNGAGKTSLINLLAGRIEPDQGDVATRRGLRIGLVEQFLPANLAELSLREAVLTVLPEDEAADHKADTILHALGFSADQLSSTIGQLSGGQQNLALLARAQLLEPDLLFMDEPGNHMDVSALAALGRYLHSTPNLTFLMISHDREILDDNCTRTIFLRDQTTYSFDLPYTRARLALNTQDEQAEHRRQTEEKEIARIRASAKRLAEWGKVYDNEDLARKAKSMASRAEKLDADKTFVSKGSGLELQLAASQMRSKTVFTLQKLTIHTPDNSRKLLDCDYLVAKPGDRIALLGANGTGKSTTIKRLLASRNEESEMIRFNPNVRIGYFDQELKHFSEASSRYDWLAQRVDASEHQIKQTLLHAGVSYADFSQAVTGLSGGEKARLMFMLLRLQQPNLMILDEPTNHIDLESREELETQLSQSGATLLITSHDRQFLDSICNRFWRIENQQLIEIDQLEDYYNHLAKDVSVSSKQATQPKDIQQEYRDDDAILERIEALEHLLQADLARKLKFQKPKRQQEWQNELETLWSQLKDR
ncbi:MAG: ABC-F family ATP-binding cassette domain-containing protein [Pseudomonadota bacterium]